MVKVVSSVTIDPALLAEAKANGISLSQTLEDALKMELTGTEIRPDSHVPKEYLDGCLDKIRENHKLVHGISRRIYNVHGIKIPIKRLLELAREPAEKPAEKPAEEPKGEYVRPPLL